MKPDDSMPMRGEYVMRQWARSPVAIPLYQMVRGDRPALAAWLCGYCGEPKRTGGGMLAHLRRRHGVAPAQARLFDAIEGKDYAKPGLDATSKLRKQNAHSGDHKKRPEGDRRNARDARETS